jgi:hypothetical protein
MPAKQPDVTPRTGYWGEQYKRPYENKAYLSSLPKILTTLEIHKA